MSPSRKQCSCAIVLFFAIAGVLGAAPGALAEGGRGNDTLVGNSGRNLIDCALVDGTGVAGTSSATS